MRPRLSVRQKWIVSDPVWTLSAPPLNRSPGGCTHNTHACTHTHSYTHTVFCSYEKEGGETALRQLNDRINSIKSEVEEKAEEKKKLEEKIRRLQKEIANVEVS